VSRRRPLWLALALLLFASGCFATVLGAREVARNDGQTSRQLVDSSSADIVSTLNLAIQHEQDLVDATGAFFASFPSANQSDFRSWMAAAHAFQRYPELTGIAEVVIVSRSSLGAFEATVTRDPTGTLGPQGNFVITPSGNRAYYCLAKVEITRPGGMHEPAGLDFCDTPLGPLFLKARDSGRGAYFPYGSGATEEFVVGTPVYSTGAVPATIPERRADFVGWTGTLLVPHELLVTALKGHPHTAVKFQYQQDSTKATFSAGSAPRGAQSRFASLHNGWRVKTFAVVDRGLVQDNANALALLLIGVAMSLFLGALIYLLGTGRSRAVALVHDRTRELEHLALHDGLTGLPNRALILDRIDQMIARARRDHTEVALLFLDLDNFKDINDTLGHPAGDQLLIEVGNRLAKTLREGDTVGRIGGDEFVILAEGASLAPGAEALADRILGVMAVPFVIPASETPLDVSASIGIAEGMRSAPEDLLRDADIAMYRAKGVGKQRAVMFLPSMQEAIVDSRTLSVDLHSALEKDEFFLQYQPIVSLESAVITGVEALLRWRHPVRGVIQPDHFIPALETSGLIVPVGLWVLQEACRRGAAWHDEGRQLSVSVNISARQLERDRIVDDVQSALRASNFDPAALILELTETTLMVDVEETSERLKLLKALGVRLAIDDFGTGYSSLAYVRRFPIDIIKIDRSFVSGEVNSLEAATLVHTLVQLGKDLGLTTVAEGVETNEQRLRLIEESADAAQGFYFARPLDAEAIDQLLNSVSQQAIPSTT